jgi:hypothetical protein
LAGYWISKFDIGITFFSHIAVTRCGYEKLVPNLLLTMRALIPFLWLPYHFVTCLCSCISMTH